MYNHRTRARSLLHRKQESLTLNDFYMKLFDLLIQAIAFDIGTMVFKTLHVKNLGRE
jgi:hypothetical protein